MLTINEIIFFLCGLLTFPLAMFISDFLKGPGVNQIDKSNWSKITSYQFDYNFDFIFDKEMTVQEVIYGVTECCKQKIETDGEQFSNIMVSPGIYSVSASTLLTFTHRE